MPFPLMSGFQWEEVCSSLVLHSLWKPQQNSVLEVTHTWVICRPERIDRRGASITSCVFIVHRDYTELTAEGTTGTEWPHVLFISRCPPFIQFTVHWTPSVDRWPQQVERFTAKGASGLAWKDFSFTSQILWLSFQCLFPLAKWLLRSEEKISGSCHVCIQPLCHSAGASNWDKGQDTSWCGSLRWTLRLSSL